MYRERMDHEEDPYHQFMSDGAQLWRRLTPNGENFTFRDPFEELPIEIQLKKQEAKRMRVEKAQEKQMLMADSRRNTLRRPLNPSRNESGQSWCQEEEEAGQARFYSK